MADSNKPEPDAVEAAWFALGREFTYTGPHDPESAHGIVAAFRPAIEAAIRATPSTDLDVDRLLEAMNTAYSYEDDDNAVPTLPFYDDVDAFWSPFTAAVAREYRALGERKEETKHEHIFKWSDIRAYKQGGPKPLCRVCKE